MTPEFGSSVELVSSAHANDESCGFDEYCDTASFFEFEKNLECELAVLEDRWSRFASPAAEFGRRRSFSAQVASPSADPRKPR